AKKRVVAEKLMLGLYLYFLPTVWMRGDYDAQRKVFYPDANEEQRCAYEMYARAGLIARQHPGVAIPRPAPSAQEAPAASRAPAPQSERVTAARAVLETAEREAGMRPQRNDASAAPRGASDKQLGLIITLIGTLRTANPAAVNAIGERYHIADLARFAAREQL